MKKLILTIVSVLFFNIFCFAYTKTYVKEGTEKITSNQTQQSIEKQLKQTLMTAVLQEEGIVISIKNKKITEDDYFNILETFTKPKILEKGNKQKAVYMKIEIEIDTDSVESYLKKIKEYDEKISELEEKTDQLKNKLKTQDNTENSNISNELSALVEQKKQKEIFLNNMVVNVKERYQKHQNYRVLINVSYYNDILKKITPIWLSVSKKFSSQKSIPLKAVASFVIAGDGSVSDIKIEKSSGNKIFDKKVMKTIKSAGPFSPLPLDYDEDDLKIYFEFCFPVLLFRFPNIEFMEGKTEYKILQNETETKQQKSDEFKYSYYLNGVIKKLGKYWCFSETGSSFKAVTSFVIARDGTVSDIKIEESSGNDSFDKKAIDAINSASPFSPLPEGYAKDNVKIYFKFNFSGDKK